MELERTIFTIDTHTEGGPTRIIISGIPSLQGKTMAEKMEFFRKNHDELRKFLVFEPRGHQGMFAAVLTEPVNPKADIGAFFLTHSGYLGMCVHSAIGVATAYLETGMRSSKKGSKAVKIDTPLGLITLEPEENEGRLRSLTLKTNPAFVYKDEVLIDIGKPLKVSIVFSSVFFLLLDVSQLGLSVERKNLPELQKVGVSLLEAANKSLSISHPQDPWIGSIELAMIYEDLGPYRTRNVVVSRAGSVDRSPCGAGTGAKMTYLFARGKLKLDEEYVSQGVFETSFRGKLVESLMVGPYQGAIPQITGAAYITGFHQFVLDKNDPLRTGI